MHSLRPQPTPPTSPRGVKRAHAADSATLVLVERTAAPRLDRERPFACPERGCFQRFKRKFTLKEHLKTHTGEKPFVCPVQACAKTFTTSGNLARHKRLHPWLKAQVCLVDGCARAFSNELQLERHMKTHFKGPRVFYDCAFAGCGKRFSTSGNLTRHVKQQHSGDSHASAAHRRSVDHTDGEDLDDDCSSASGDHQVHSPCGVEDPKVARHSTATSKSWPDAHAFHPLTGDDDDCIAVDDAELLETLRCLF